MRQRAFPLPHFVFLKCSAARCIPPMLDAHFQQIPLNICKVAVPTETVWMRFPIDPLPRPLAFALLFSIVTGISARAAEQESADLRYFRELVETRNYSLGQPVPPKITPDGKAVIFLRG